MSPARRRRSTRSRILWAAFGLALLVALCVAYFQLAVQPTLWDALTNGANY
ncbi:MAG: hypothetical protein ACR2GO_02175 [Candidatus Limnocylindria bacterium]